MNDLVIKRIAQQRGECAGIGIGRMARFVVACVGWAVERAWCVKAGENASTSR